MLYSNTNAAINAVTATTIKAKGFAFITIFNAFCANAAAFCATVNAIVFAVLAAFTIASFAYSATILAVSILSFIFATVHADIAFFIFSKIDTIPPAFTINSPNFIAFHAAINPATATVAVLIVPGCFSHQSENLFSTPLIPSHIVVNAPAVQLAILVNTLSHSHLNNGFNASITALSMFIAFLRVSKNLGTTSLAVHVPNGTNTFFQNQSKPSPTLMANGVSAFHKLFKDFSIFP